MDSLKDTGKYKVGIYARESRDEKEENYETIETQRDLLIDFVKRSRLGEIGSIYMDDNVSGSAFHRRGIEALKSDIREGNINLLVVKDLSRLGRNNAQTLLFLDFLEEYGVRVITFDGRYDSLKDNDTVGIETWFNERYIRDISRKIRTNLKFKIQNGEYLGHAPYGYLKAQDKRNRLVVNQQEAEVVREIFDLYLEGLGYSKIAKLLNSKEYCPPSCKYSGISNGWNGVAVQRILSNRAYTGDTVQGVSEKISFKSKKTRRLPREDWVVTSDTHEPIIKRDFFEEVQKLKCLRRTSQKTGKGTLHVLKGLLYCGRCGNAMFARARKNRPMGYICSTYASKGKTACTSHYLREDVVLDQLEGELLHMLEQTELLKTAETQMLNGIQKVCGGTGQAEQLKQQLQGKRRQQEVLYLDRLEERISQQLFERMNSNIEGSIQSIEKRIGEYSKNAHNIADIRETAAQLEQHIQKYGLSNRLVRLFVDRITIYDRDDAKKLLMDRNPPGALYNGEEEVIVIDFR
jgi:DNA invertase Pin-like site-specific DNA recombinase